MRKNKLANDFKAMNKDINSALYIQWENKVETTLTQTLFNVMYSYCARKVKKNIESTLIQNFDIELDQSQQKLEI